ncbi:MAG: WhiB family transcriptional regulator [Actinobacteria bacterium]|nr:WhiB family transcriptional regulator [Actinomycetota bacterium]
MRGQMSDFKFTFDVAKAEYATKGSCLGHPHHMWFPELGDPGNGAVEAKKICSTCPVKVECLEYGIDTKSYGIWGGITLRNGIPNRKRGRKPNANKTELGMQSL